jgi:hypothetical protein
MANTSTISRALLHWLDIKAVLVALFAAALLAWLLLRGERWQKLGLGWQFWSLVLIAAAAVTLAASAGACFVGRRAQFGLRTLLLLILLVTPDPFVSRGTN